MQLNLPIKISYSDRIASLLRACKPEKDKVALMEHRKIVEDVANRFIEDGIIHKIDYASFFEKCGV